MAHFQGELTGRGKKRIATGSKTSGMSAIVSTDTHGVYLETFRAKADDQIMVHMTTHEHWDFSRRGIRLGHVTRAIVGQDAQGRPVWDVVFIPEFADGMVINGPDNKAQFIPNK